VKEAPETETRSLLVWSLCTSILWAIGWLAGQAEGFKTCLHNYLAPLLLALNNPWLLIALWLYAKHVLYWFILWF